MCWHYWMLHRFFRKTLHDFLVCDLLTGFPKGSYLRTKCPVVLQTFNDMPRGAGKENSNSKSTS